MPVFGRDLPIRQEDHQRHRCDVDKPKYSKFSHKFLQIYPHLFECLETSKHKDQSNNDPESYQYRPSQAIEHMVSVMLMTYFSHNCDDYVDESEASDYVIEELLKGKKRSKFLPL